jgi:hypothetical protein
MRLNDTKVQKPQIEIQEALSPPGTRARAWGRVGALVLSASMLQRGLEERELAAF